jgi:hypothetical protein
VDNDKMDLGGIGRGGVVWTGLVWLTIVESCSECGNEISGSIKCRGIIEWLHD